MTLIGTFLIFWFYRSKKRIFENTIYLQPNEKKNNDNYDIKNDLWMRRVIFTFFVILPIIIPSDWTQDIPSRYGERHSGLEYSKIYPPIN